MFPPICYKQLCVSVRVISACENIVIERSRVVK